MIEVKVCIREMRLRKGLSLVELAEKSGVSKTHIADIETGKKIPGLQVLCQLADALGVDARDLFTY
jgi:transcriptional regulator with XRE-family HTH domain